MYDERPVGTHFNQPTLIALRFAGAGASVPTPVANVKDAAASRCTITRSGVGTLSIQLLDTPLGVVQSYGFWVESGSADKNVRVTPPAAANYTFTANITYHANGVAVDLANGEELVAEIWAARTSQP
jgi:hypothetical protein